MAAVDDVAVAEPAHSETDRAAAGMPVQLRMQVLGLARRLGRERGCLTPKAITVAWLPLRARSGSVNDHRNSPVAIMGIPRSGLWVLAGVQLACG